MSVELYERYGSPQGEQPSEPKIFRWRYIAAISALIIGFFLGQASKDRVEVPVIKIVRDTTVVRDTVQGKVLPPVERVVYRYETVRPQISPAKPLTIPSGVTTSLTPLDTASRIRSNPDGTISVPIERRVYSTDDYRAVISGWRPTLDSIQVYGKTRTITETRTETRKKRPWLALTLNGGMSYATEDAPVTVAGVGFRPTVGIGLGFVIKSW